jgi:Zn-dependent oligopeptidase
MTYADNRIHRENLSKAFGSKCFKKDSLDNQDIVKRIAQLRFERAQLLGYKTQAHFVLEQRMAETPEKVTEFLNDLLEKAKPAALEEFDNLKAFAKELDGIDQLQKMGFGILFRKTEAKIIQLRR